ncbi:hypothetical protein LX36DRAFT_752159 [Colletotrichum falcatum]|nr:hypothetical protein LX36DRAFT_752159 [Colletotrichum falcatum]
MDLPEPPLLVLPKGERLRLLAEELMQVVKWLATPEGKASWIAVRRNRNPGRDLAQEFWKTRLEARLDRKTFQEPIEKSMEAEELRKQANRGAKMVEKSNKELEGEPGIGRKAKEAKNAKDTKDARGASEESEAEPGAEEYVKEFESGNEDEE